MKEHKFHLETAICKRCGASETMVQDNPTLGCVGAAEFLWSRICGMGAALAYLAVCGIDWTLTKLRRKFK